MPTLVRTAEQCELVVVTIAYLKSWLYLNSPPRSNKLNDQLHKNKNKRIFIIKLI